jgi:pimeloyl-ACP methyl ester carboxylesterase
MHGTPGCRLLDARRVEQRFEELLAGLGIRFVTYDRPGYGRSDRQRGRGVRDTAGDVATIADALEIQRFAVVGGSGGSAHALAVAALLPERVIRVACVAPMAPYDQLGSDEWFKDQLDGVRQYVSACLPGEVQAAQQIAGEDAEMREAAQDDPNQVDVIEQTRNGIWGWVDDELAVLSAWGFDCRDISAQPRCGTTRMRRSFHLSIRAGLRTQFRTRRSSPRTRSATAPPATRSRTGTASTRGSSAARDSSLRLRGRAPASAPPRVHSATPVKPFCARSAAPGAGAGETLLLGPRRVVATALGQSAELNGA